MESMYIYIYIYIKCIYVGYIPYIKPLTLSPQAVYTEYMSTLYTVLKVCIDKQQKYTEKKELIKDSQSLYLYSRIEKKGTKTIKKCQKLIHF